VANRTIGHSIEHPAQGLGVEGPRDGATRREGTRERPHGQAAETSRANRSRLYTPHNTGVRSLHALGLKREARGAMRKGPAVARRSAHSLREQRVTGKASRRLITQSVLGSNPAFGTKLATRKAYAWMERDIRANFEGNLVQGGSDVFVTAGLRTSPKRVEGPKGRPLRARIPRAAKAREVARLESSWPWPNTVGYSLSCTLQ
jgi:hypothetical protein